MDVFIARQPIFDKYENVKAYELLYRDAEHMDRAVIDNQSLATQSVIATAMTVLDLQMLSNYTRAFVNFNCELIMNDFIKTVNPDDVVIKLPPNSYEDIDIINKIKELHKQGYLFALEDNWDNPEFKVILPAISYIIIDIRNYKVDSINRILRKYHKLPVKTLATKIETREEYESLLNLNIDLFQGFFFEKPMLIRDKSIDVSKLNYFRLINELNKESMDFLAIANIIKLDTALTYQLFKKLNKVQYIHMNKSKDIMNCLVRLGEDELRAWLLLIVIRRFNQHKSDELAKHAYIRGIFMELMMSEAEPMDIKRKSKDGYLVGMFSMLPQISDMSMESILADLHLPREINDALMGIDDGNNVLKEMLDLVIYYETGACEKPEIAQRLNLKDEKIFNFYTDCIFAGDVAFRN